MINNITTGYVSITNIFNPSLNSMQPDVQAALITYLIK